MCINFKFYNILKLYFISNNFILPVGCLGRFKNTNLLFKYVSFNIIITKKYRNLTSQNNATCSSFFHRHNA